MLELKERILYAGSGTIFVAKEKKQEKMLRDYVKLECLCEGLPNIFYKPYKRKEELSIDDVLKLSKKYAKHRYNSLLIPRGKTALYVSEYDRVKDLDVLEFYLPNSKYEEYQLGKYRVCFHRRPLQVQTYLFGRAATIIELLRYIGKENMTEEVRQALKEKIPQAKIRQILRKKKNLSKWMRIELEKIYHERADFML